MAHLRCGNELPWEARPVGQIYGRLRCPILRPPCRRVWRRGLHQRTPYSCSFFQEQRDLEMPRLASVANVFVSR